MYHIYHKENYYFDVIRINGLEKKQITQKM